MLVMPPMSRKRGFPLLLALSAGGFAACGPAKVAPLPPRPPAASTSASSAGVAAAPPMPKPLAGVTVGAFGEGTFGPRLSRNGKSAILVSAPRGDSGRRWFAVALDDKDAPIDASRHEIAEAPDDASAWALEPVGDGFVLAWTRPSDSGEQLLAVALAADGSPRSSPASIAKSGDDLVAVRLIAMGDGALLTWGEKLVPKGGISATGTLFAMTLDALGRPTAQTPTRVADKLSAWQVTPAGPGTAVAALVQRNEPKAGLKEEKLAAREDLARSASVLTVTVTTKGLSVSETTLLSNDDALPEIDVVRTAAGRALVVWSDRREVDAHLFAVAVDVSGAKPKMLGTPKRAAPPHGDQAIVATVPSKDGAIVMFEIVSPRSLRDPRRRFELARLSSDGEAVAKPRGFAFPYENDEPELVRAGDDDVAVLTYGQACVARGTEVTCDSTDVRPWLVRFGGPTLSLKQSDVVDVGKLVGGAAMHAFDPSCTSARCDVLAEGPGNPATVAIARVPVRDSDKADPRWVFRELVETSASPPRLEGATAVAREPEFTGLHAVRAGSGSLVGWITYAPDDIDVDAQPEPKAKKGDKGDKLKAKKKKPAETGARVGVRLLDGAGEPIGPITVVSEKALSKGDVAVAWSLLEPKGEGKKPEGAGGLVAYVSRAEGDEEVYVARIDGKGLKNGKSSRVTNAKGPASDVALTALAEGGYVLGWVEARKGGAPAVYAVRLDKSGQKVGTEVKIGGGIAGDISDLSLVTLGTGAAGARVVAVWSDARDDATHGYGDVYYAILGTKDLGKPVLSERPLARTKTHSHYPVITARGDGGALVAWVEDDPSATEFLETVGRPDWGARVARIDAQGVIVQSATDVALDPALGKGVATGVSLDCPTGPSSCRLAIAWATREGIALLGSPIGASTPTPARVLWSWFGAPSQEVAPSIVGTAIYAAEDGLEKDDGRVRRLSIAW